MSYPLYLSTSLHSSDFDSLEEKKLRRKKENEEQKEEKEENKKTNVKGKQKAKEKKNVKGKEKEEKEKKGKTMNVKVNKEKEKKEKENEENKEDKEKENKEKQEKEYNKEEKEENKEDKEKENKEEEKEKGEKKETGREDKEREKEDKEEKENRAMKNKEKKKETDKGSEKLEESEKEKGRKETEKVKEEKENEKSGTNSKEDAYQEKESEQRGESTCETVVLETEEPQAEKPSKRELQEKGIRARMRKVRFEKGESQIKPVVRNHKATEIRGKNSKKGETPAEEKKDKAELQNDNGERRFIFLGMRCLQVQDFFKSSRWLHIRQEVLDSVCTFLTAEVGLSTNAIDRAFVFHQSFADADRTWEDFVPEYADTGGSALLPGIYLGPDLPRLPACLYRAFERPEEMMGSGVHQPLPWLVSDACLLVQVEAAFHRFDKEKMLQKLTEYKTLLSDSERAVIQRAITRFNKKVYIIDRECLYRYTPTNKSR